MSAYAPGELDRMEAEDRAFWKQQRALRAQGIETGNLRTLSSPWTGVSAQSRAEADSAWADATSAARRRF